jgi:hypothetical protein
MINEYDIFFFIFINNIYGNMYIYKNLKNCL